MLLEKPFYFSLVEHYDRCLAKHGASPSGVDWPNAADLEKRFNVMLDLCRLEKSTEKISLLDLGCGFGALVDYIYKNGLDNKLSYSGIDLSANMIHQAKLLHSHIDFEVRDILIDGLSANLHDYIIMNGLMTEKGNITQEKMETFMADILRVTFAACNKGIAFNVMNFHVDWFRDDLFHLPFDRLVAIVLKNCSRDFVIRSDYGLYEYTVYVYKNPR